MRRFLLLLAIAVFAISLEAKENCTEGKCQIVGPCLPGEGAFGIARQVCCRGGQEVDEFATCLTDFIKDVNVTVDVYHEGSSGRGGRWDFAGAWIDVGTSIRPFFGGGMRFEPAFDIGLGAGRAEAELDGVPLYRGTGTHLSVGGELYVTPSPRTPFSIGVETKYRTILDAPAFRPTVIDPLRVGTLEYRTFETDVSMRYAFTDRFRAKAGGRLTRSSANADQQLPSGTQLVDIDLDRKEFVGGIDFGFHRNLSLGVEVATNGDDYKTLAGITFQVPRNVTLQAPIASDLWGLHYLAVGLGPTFNCIPYGTNCFDDVVIERDRPALARLNAATDTGKTADYFRGDDWRQLFPGLANFPRQLGLLQEGLPLLRIDQPERRTTRYIATRLTRDQLNTQLGARQPVPLKGIEFCLSVKHADEPNP